MSISIVHSIGRDSETFAVPSSKN